MYPPTRSTLDRAETILSKLEGEKGFTFISGEDYSILLEVFAFHKDYLFNKRELTIVACDSSVILIPLVISLLVVFIEPWLILLSVVLFLVYLNILREQHKIAKVFYKDKGLSHDPGVTYTIYKFNTDYSQDIVNGIKEARDFYRSVQ